MIDVSWGNHLDIEPPRKTLAVDLCPLKRIIREVCVNRNIEYRQMMSKRRRRNVAHARQEAYWRCYNETGASYPEIGRMMGRDHTSVMYGAREHEKRMKANHADSINEKPSV